MQYLNQINSGNSHFPNFQFVVLFDHFALWACAVTNFFSHFVQFRRLEKAGVGGEGKRSRNSDRKWTRAFLGKHEQTESLSSTKRN